jgi:TonB-dependent starch-binding outer membrane protein SusC
MNFKILLSRLLFGIVMVLIVNSAYAQNITISGLVTDSKDKQPLIGVSVTVKGSPIGTSTGVDGTFRLSAPANAATLVFSYLGYNNLEVAINGRTSVSVSLEPSSTSLSEVVVIGYGSQKVKDATGSVSSLGTKEFNKGVIASPEQLLQGRVAGVQVTPASGEPGSGISINIRGTGSIRSGNNPLFVVDGVPLDGGGTSGGLDIGAGTSSARNPLSFLNPSDIENISILKDASASAIYGSRGANGVVLITTKKGGANQGIQFGASTSMSKNAKRYDLLSAQDFVIGVQRSGGIASKIDRGGVTDWQDEVFQTGISQNYNLGFGGSKATNSYRVSLGYDDQEGTIKNSSLSRLTGRLNASQTIFKDKIKFDLSLTASNVKNKYAPVSDNAGFQGSLVGAAIAANPTNPVKNADGTFFSIGERNPAAMLEYIDDSDNINRYLGNISGTWNIVKGLAYKATLGLDNSKSKRETWYDPRLTTFGDATRIRELDVSSVSGNGRGTEQNVELITTLVENTLTYDVSVAGNPLTALIGTSYQKFKFNSYNKIGFVTKVPNVLVKSLSDFQKQFPIYGDSSVAELQSFFTRVNYNLNDKYLITGTLRADGSSKFGENNKYAYFPAVAVKWKIMNESFMPKNIFDDLGIRLNYGLTGNSEFPGGAALAVTQRQLDPSQKELNAGNPNIKWETTTQYGIGLDYAILKGRISGTVDYFNKNTSDLIFLQDYAQPAAFERRWTNLKGNVINKGVEVGLNLQAVQGKKFTWDVNYNMTFIKNSIKNFGNTNVITGDINGQGLSGAYVQLIKNGSPLASFNLPTFTRYDGNGFAIYPNDAAFILQGSALPKFNAGLTNNFTFGKWSASFFLNASTGFLIYNNTANALFTKGSLKNARNVTYDTFNSVENPLNPPEVSTRFLEKGDFLRLSNANLGYTFNVANMKTLKSLRVSVSGQNIFLITNYSGLDPEVNTNKARNSVPSRGIDYTAYPSARTFTFGLNAGF